MKKSILITSMVIITLFTWACQPKTDEAVVSDIEIQQVELTEENVYVSKYASISKDSWASINTENTRYSSVDEFLTEIDYYVDEITTYLDRQAWLDELTSQEVEANRRIEFKFTTTISQANGGGASYSEKFIKPVISLNIDEFESGHMLITHELTHIISPYTMSWSLSEGLACFIQDNISLNNKQFLFEGELFESTKLLFDDGYDYLCDYLGSLENGKNNLQTSDRYELLAYYITSSSFAKFIEVNYGFDHYMALYNSDCTDESYMQIFGMNREELINKFKDMINES